MSQPEELSSLHVRWYPEPFQLQTSWLSKRLSSLLQARKCLLLGLDAGKFLPTKLLINSTTSGPRSLNKATLTAEQAVKAGYRLFDGAYDYGNEKECGEGLQRAIKDGLVKREELFITSKVWNNYHRREHCLEMAKKQNESWGLEYIDLFLIHFPVALKYIDPEIRRYPVRHVPVLTIPPCLR